MDVVDAGTGASAGERGNTLVELLIVVAIVAILAAIAIPAFLSQRGRATEASMRSDLRAAAARMETFYADHQRYPADVTELGATLTSSDHTTITLEQSTGDAYCLLAENESVHSPLRYDSDGGGVLDTGEPCG